MRSTDRITAHIFQDTNLMTDGGIIYGTSQRTEIMMIAYTFEWSSLPIQEKSFVGNDFNSTDTE